MELEQEARQLGWVPQDEWKGDPGKWRSAEEFVERGHTVMPILQKNNERLLGEIGGLNEKVSTLEATVAAAQEALEAFQEYHNETAKREYNRALKDLKAQKVDAIREGDAEKVVEIDDAIGELNNAAPKELKKPEPKTQETPAVSPENLALLQQWERDNSSWLTDSEKRAYAQVAGQFLRATGNTKVGRAFLDDVTQEVERRFGNSRKEGTVEGGGRGTGTRSGGRSFADLPPEAQAACDRFGSKLVGKGRVYETLDDWRKKYVKDYVWE